MTDDTVTGEKATPEPPVVTCRHEFVRIYQRKLKGLERRLVATKAYLPVGFKMADFSHLGEGSYCFCTKCRARLFPKRTAAEKAAARQAAAESKALAEEALAAAAAEEVADELETSDEMALASNEDVSVNVEELEIESVELEDLDTTRVSMDDEGGSCQMPSDEE